MSKTNETRPQEPKQPKTVLVKVWFPWVLIAVIVAVAIGYWSGWVARSDMNVTIDAEVTRQFEQVSKIRK